MNRLFVFSLLTSHFSIMFAAATFAQTQPASAPTTTQAAEFVAESAPAPTTLEADEAATTLPGTLPTQAPKARKISTRPSTSPGKPNILLISTDDQSFGLCGFEGGKVKTPNLDRLAQQSIHFTRCYVPTPQCAPTRASILTGLYPHSHGVVHDGLALRKTSDTITARLRRAGYSGGFIGQWQLGLTRDEAPGFGLSDFTATNDAPATPEAWASVDVRINGTPGKTDRFLTEWQAEQAIDCLYEFADRPFFIWLSLNAPHEPFTYPPGTERLYAPETLDLPVMVAPKVQFWPSKLQQIQPYHRHRQFNEAALRDQLARYYATITDMDEQIGRVLKELDELKLAENTWVIFTSDSGFSLGQHTLFGKGPTFFEQMIRVPLLVRPPHTEFAGQKTEHMISLVDLAPSLCEATGLDVPTTMQGRSFMPLIKDPNQAAWSDEVFFEYDKFVDPQATMEAKMRGVIALHFKLVDYLDDTDMFFDLKRDPDELTNAVNAPHYMGVSKVLRDRLTRWRQETRDPLPAQ